MKGNPVIWLLLQVVVLGYLIYQLFGPGEAQSQTVVIMEIVALVLVSLGMVGSIMRVTSPK
jgi:hypothetical protein